MRTLVLSIAAGWLIANAAIAGECCKAPPTCGEVQTCGGPNCCGHCGCKCCCEKYCQVVCEMKEIKKFCWVVHCEDFCASLPGCPGHCRNTNGGCCEACERMVQGNGCGCGKKCCDPCAVEESKCRVPPKCGNVRTRKTLEKKEIICKIPCYKCVVVYCCPHCGAECGAPQPAAPAPAAPAPSAPGKTTDNAPMPPLATASANP
jgi:hypothetical protein